MPNFKVGDLIEPDPNDWDYGDGKIKHITTHAGSPPWIVSGVEEDENWGNFVSLKEYNIETACICPFSSTRFRLFVQPEKEKTPLKNHCWML